MEKNLEISDAATIRRYGSIPLVHQGTFGEPFYVDGTDGSATNNGKSWNSALLTIQAALDLCTARGYHTIYVRSGAYQETLTTPINATAPFCQLIGVDPTNRGYGVYLYPASAGQTILTLNARGWRVSGFEFESSTGEGIRLVREAGGVNRSDYARIDHCHFTFSYYGIRHWGGAYHIEIDHNEFDNINVGAIFSSDSAWASPRNWAIHHNEFVENTAHIKFGPSQGLNYSKIFKNIMQGTGSSKSAKDDALIDIRGGSAGVNVVSQNVLGIIAGNAAGGYDNAGGPCYAGTNDIWVANYTQGGVEDANPGGG